MTDRLREAARELLEQSKVSLVVGYERGSTGYRARPSFVSTPEEARRLIWDSTCSNNLAAYLPSLFQRPPQKKGAETPLPRIAFVAKGCDLRSIVALVKERQAPRENLVLIGVPCKGMIDSRKLSAASGGAEIVELSEEGGATFSARAADGRTLTFDREPMLQEACLSCRYPLPQGADILIEGMARQANDDGGATARSGDGMATHPRDGEEVVREIEALPVEERWRRFSAEMSRCIRCYACRQACPTCYCKECFAEQNNPAWIGVGAEGTDVAIFHLIRIFHQAGRCVECDACVRACPVGIDLRPWSRKIAAEVRALYGYTPDFDLTKKPPLTTFKEDDPQAFITEPGADSVGDEHCGPGGKTHGGPEGGSNG